MIIIGNALCQLFSLKWQIYFWENVSQITQVRITSLSVHSSIMFFYKKWLGQLTIINSLAKCFSSAYYTFTFVICNKNALCVLYILLQRMLKRCAVKRLRFNQIIFTDSRTLLSETSFKKMLMHGYEYSDYSYSWGHCLPSLAQAVLPTITVAHQSTCQHIIMVKKTNNIFLLLWNSFDVSDPFEKIGIPRGLQITFWEPNYGVS